MVKHNNMLPNVHFHKWWQRYVKTWFNQPARKAARRFARQRKLAKIAPRPLKLLRPVVHPPTQRYNMKTRLGKGFSLEELKQRGMTKKTARTIGIAVDHRRKNRCVESLALNSKRLEDYRQKAIIFPRRKGKAKLGFGGIPKDSTGDALKSASQVPVSVVVPIKKGIIKPPARTITQKDKEFKAYNTLRLAHLEALRVGKVKAADQDIKAV